VKHAGTVSLVTCNKPDRARTFRAGRWACSRVLGVPGPDLIERTLAAVRRQGGRVTDQRRAILRVLFEQSDHVSADELATRAHAQLPDVHVTTVYRFLEVLEEMGLVSHVHLGHGPAVYHLVDSTHAHVVCDRCGDVGVIDTDLMHRWSAQLAKTSGFSLVEQHFALAGRCATCRATDTRP
jgi:Fur family transcriptional regulator, ferric uptake regulator